MFIPRFTCLCSDGARQQQQQLSLNWVAGEKVVQNRLKNEKRMRASHCVIFHSPLHVYMGICFTARSSRFSLLFSTRSLHSAPLYSTHSLHDDECGCIKWLQSIGLLVRLVKVTHAIHAYAQWWDSKSITENTTAADGTSLQISSLLYLHCTNGKHWIDLIEC